MLQSFKKKYKKVSIKGCKQSVSNPWAQLPQLCVFPGVIVWVQNALRLFIQNQQTLYKYCCVQMSEARLDTCEFQPKQHRPSTILTLQTSTFSHRDTVKIEEMELQPQSLQHPSPPTPSSRQLQYPSMIRQRQVRAHYRDSSQCPPVGIQYRILQHIKEQKSLRGKGQKIRERKIASNQTKNIAKNYGKAIVAFIQRNKKIFRAVCKLTSTPYQRINEELGQLKGNLTTVMGFRRVWTDYKYSECMRVVSHIFLRKGALGYIFNSKVANVQTHIKYRNKFLEALRNPASFDHIKDY